MMAFEAFFEHWKLIGGERGSTLSALQPPNFAACYRVKTQGFCEGKKKVEVKIKVAFIESLKILIKYRN